MEIGHPAIQSGVLPLASAFLLTAVLRLVGPGGRGKRIASAAVGIALLTSSVLVLGAPVWPVHAGMQKFFYLVAGGLLVGVLLDLRGASPRLLLLSGLIWMAATFVWLAWPQLDRPHTFWLLAGICVAGLTVILRVTDRPGHDTSAPIMFVVTASSLGGIAFFEGSLSIAELGFALAAALGGFILWNWPQPRYPFGAAGLLGGGMAVLALAFLALLLTDVSPWTLLPLVLIFFADSLSRRLPAGGVCCARPCSRSTCWWWAQFPALRRLCSPGSAESRTTCIINRPEPVHRCTDPDDVKYSTFQQCIQEISRDELSGPAMNKPLYARRPYECSRQSRRLLSAKFGHG